MDIVVTIPKVKPNEAEVSINEYRETAKKVVAHYFRVGKVPRKVQTNDRCFVVIDGYVRGYHLILHVRELSDQDAAELSGGNWLGGYYIVRTSGTWTEIEPVPMRGFMGFRYVDKDTAQRWLHAKKI